VGLARGNSLAAPRFPLSAAINKARALGRESCHLCMLEGGEKWEVGSFKF